MGKRQVFWIAAAIATGMWLLGMWGFQVEAGQAPTEPSSACAVEAPLQQNCPACQQQPDLQIRTIRLEPDPPGVNQSYNIHVEIYNACATSSSDSWAHLYIDRAPSGPPDIEAYASTAGLGTGQSIEAHFTITPAYAIAGWHTLAVEIDAQNDVPNEACNGEANNSGATTFEIRQVYPTSTPFPTATPFPPPEIYVFTPESAEIAYGESVVLRWQVNGQAVTVWLDGELMPLVHSETVYPDEDHVYTLRAENPAGSVQRTSRITLVDPTATPTLTPTPCDFPVIHEFGSSPSSVIRGGDVTLYWDVSRADAVFLNGVGVSAVSAKQFRLDYTTEFVLVARNKCGEISETLTVQARYATPTFTLTPTRTATPTYTPSPTPTRNVLPTPTGTPTRGTSTPAATATDSTFDSPVGPGTPTRTAIVTPTGTLTGTSTITPVLTPTETGTLVPETPTLMPTLTLVPTQPPATSTAVVIVGPTDTAVAQATALAPTATWTPAPTPSAALSSNSGSIRAYLCPLSVLLLFALGVLILSVVMPRIQERRQGFETFQHAVSVYGVVPPNQQGDEPGMDAGVPYSDAPQPPIDEDAS